MHWFRFAILVIVTAILQSGIVDLFAIGTVDVKPQLLLILLVFFAIYCNRFEAIIASFVIGFCADIIVPTMGPYTLSFGIFGTLMAYLNSVISVRKMLYQFFAILIIGVLTGLSAYFFSSLKGLSIASGIQSVIFYRSLYSGVIGPFVFLPIAWWMRIKTHHFRYR